MPSRRSTLALLVALTLAGCAPGPRAPDAPESLACDAAALAIGRVQGTAAVAPPRRDPVTVRGVVTLTAPALGGLFLENEPDDRDAEAATADGVFLALDGELPPVGTRLVVRGRVSERGEGTDTVTTLEPSVPPARCGVAAVPLTRLDAPPADREALEAMRLALHGPLTVTGNDRLGRDGMLELAFGPRQFTPTDALPPGPEAAARQVEQARARLALDDADDRPWAAAPAHLGGLGPDRPWRAGTSLEPVTGVLDQRAGGWRLRVDAALRIREAAPRPAPPAVVPGTLRVVAANLLNWFNGDGRGGGFPTARGAANAEAAARQRAKLVAMLAALAPDVAALMEVENDGTDPGSALAELVDALNAALGPDGDYRPVHHGRGRLGGDEIAVALIYRAGRVRPEGPARVLEGGAFDWGNRVPLAQRFAPRAGGRGLLVVANHFKSKRCEGARGAEADRGDGQSCWAALRARAAGELADWLARQPAAADGQVLVLGDLNAYAQEDALRTFARAGLHDLVAAHEPAPQRYSFVFRGAAGRLDHALGTATMAARVRAAAHWHVNADEPSAFEYAPWGLDPAQVPAGYRADPWRAADHDPVVLAVAP